MKPIAVAMTCLIAASSSALAPSAQAQSPIRVGTSIGLTGAYAQFGPAIQRGYELCVKSANAKGGVLARKLELTIIDDKSDARTAAAVYERLMTQDKVDLVFSPYSTEITDAASAVTEKYAKPMVAAGAAVPSLFRKGRRFLFMMLPPAERYMEGLIALAAKRGLQTVALLYEDIPFPKAIAHGAANLAKKQGLKVVALVPYPRGTKDFASILSELKAAAPDVIGAAGYYDDAVGITNSLKDLDINPKMFAPIVGSGVPKFQDTLGRTAEYIYGASAWDAAVVSIRAGGLVPIALRYPGAKELLDAYHAAFPGSDMPYQVAQGYGACQVLLEGVRRAGTLDGERIRSEIVRYEGSTTFGVFKVDADGVQIGHNVLMFQWQDGKKTIVWPEELAVDRPRYPTPPWSKRP